MSPGILSTSVLLVTSSTYRSPTEPLQTTNLRSACKLVHSVKVSTSSSFTNGARWCLTGQLQSWNKKKSDLLMITFMTAHLLGHRWRWSSQNEWFTPVQLRDLVNSVLINLYNQESSAKNKSWVEKTQLVVERKKKQQQLYLKYTFKIEMIWAVHLRKAAINQTHLEYSKQVFDCTLCLICRAAKNPSWITGLHLN